MNKYNLASGLIILISFAIGVYLYPQAPGMFPSHWNAQGHVNGYIPKFWGLFLLPLISGGLLLLLLAVPRIDPLKANIQKFRKYYDRFAVLLMVFLLYMYLLTIFWATGFTFNFIYALIPALSLLFYYAGVLMQHSKRNWFIGIRTPWTLSSEAVWNKTHKLGSKLFKAAAIVGLLGLLFPDYAIWFIIVPVLAVAAYMIAYSYVEFQKEEKDKPKKK
jgi:uncharacterized membrane protein